MIFHVAICDDMPVDILMIENKIKESNIGRVTPVKCNKFIKGEDLLESVGRGKKYDLIILDICLLGLSGEEIALMLRKKGCNALLIFCTSENVPSVESFKSEPYRFLLKSFTSERMTHEIDDILKEMIRRNKKRFVLGKKGSSIFKIKVLNVLYIELARYGCKAMVAAKGKYAKREEIRLTESIDGVEENYSEFARVHKSFLVNMYRINKVEGSNVILDDGTVLPVSRSYRQQIKGKFAEIVHATCE